MSTEILAAQIITEPVIAAEAFSLTSAADCGAVASFSGMIRNHDVGRAVSGLNYTAHPEAERILQQTVETVAQELVPADVHARIWVTHRIGGLVVGDCALLIVVATAHRRLAFELCQILVDRVKAEVPIWKEQFFSDGSVEWVGTSENP